MKKFEGILFATDLDGTLLRKDKTISEENLRAIEYFKEQGGIFTFITGRIPLGAKEILKMLEPNAPFGCINGGGIFDTEKMSFCGRRSFREKHLSLLNISTKICPKWG